MAAAASLLHLDESLLSIPEAGPAGGGSLPQRAVPLASHRGSLEGCCQASMPRVRPLRKCASTPTLHSMSAACSPSAGEDQGMEVYVVLRPFKEFGGGLFRRLPPRVRAGVRDAGICHYLAVFKQRDGTLVQFDFGPKGGDIHVARGPFAFLSKSADGKMRRLVPGEVRERRLSKLPDAHMYVGRTPLSLADIRAWNALQEQGSMDYELHKNDCRHYINCLVRYTTGHEQAASATLHHVWERGTARGTYGLASSMVKVTQFFTDLANWGKVQLISNVSMYSMMALSGQKALARLKPMSLLPSATARLQPVSKAIVGPVKHALAGPVRNALARKPVVVGTTAAVATLAASTSQAPMAQDTVTLGARVAATVKTAAQATLAAAGSAVYRASAATTRTTSQVAVVASSLAGAASRGAAGLMVGRQATIDGPAAAAAASSAGVWGRGSSSPLRASLPSFRGTDRSQRLALAITSAARR